MSEPTDRKELLLTVAVSPGALPVSTAVTPGSWPALVLNADYRPLSYYPLSLWSWQDTIKAVFLDRVTVVSCYEKAIHSPSALGSWSGTTLAR